MKCPICNQEVQPSDHSEQWGPEFAHLRCAIAFNAGSEVQDAKLQDRIRRLEDCIETAWGIIANVSGGNWAEQRPDWREATIRWRDEQFHPVRKSVAERKAKEAKL